MDIRSILRGALAVALGAGCVHGQDAALGVGFGVDTANADVRAIAGLVRAYFAKPDSSARNRGLWSANDPLFAHSGDIAGRQAYQGFPVTLVGVLPDKPGDSVYVVKLLHASVGSRSGRVSPLALQRLYAVREPGGPYPFRLTNALSRTTATWTTRSAARVTFHYAPTVAPDERGIGRAASFIDSLARAFDIPEPVHVDVYIAPALEDVQRAIGLDFFADASGPGEGRGGRTLAGRIVLVGDSTIREQYFHEYVHAVLNPAMRPRSYLVGEGIATWLGGSRGRTVREMYALLARHLTAHPGLDLRSLLREQYQSGGKLATDLVYASGALIAHAVHARRGVSGLRELAALADGDAVLSVLPRLLGLPGTDDRAIDRWWRSEAMAQSQ